MKTNDLANFAEFNHRLDQVDWKNPFAKFPDVFECFEFLNTHREILRTEIASITCGDLASLAARGGNTRSPELQAH